MAICQYLEELNPDPPLMGVDAKDRAIVSMWEKRANEEGMLPASELFRNTHPKFADRGLPGSAAPIPSTGKSSATAPARANVSVALAVSPFASGCLRFVNMK